MIMGGFSERYFIYSAEKEIGQVLNSGGRNENLHFIASYHSILKFKSGE